MKNFVMKLCYDGSRYRGWQKQGNTDNTIQGKLESALSRLLDQTVELNGSGRTDAGVHAQCQAASFRADTDMQPEQLLKRLRELMPEDIGIISVEYAPPRFHARLSCTGKTYVYRVWNSDEPNVFERKYMSFVTETLDVEAMRLAARHLCGQHDFASFCTGKSTKKSTVRRVDRVEICRLGNELRFELSGEGFLYNMVRIIVGTLLEVGRGNIAPDDIERILAARDRSAAGPTAPAKGLCLSSLTFQSAARRSDDAPARRGGNAHQH